MDGEPVEDEPSPPRDLPRTYTEAFFALLPAYMAIGMTPAEYWQGPPYLAQAFREAEEMRMHERNYGYWMQGAYIYDTLLRVAPVFQTSMSKHKVEPEKYIDQPYPLTRKEADERAEAQRRQKVRRLMEMLNKESQANRRKAKDGGESGNADKH